MPGKVDAQHDAKIAKLEAKRIAKWQKFDDKIAAFLLKHGNEDAAPPPPPPDPSTEVD